MTPKRRAEHRVYRQLAESDLPGLFIFEWKRDKNSAEVDFVVWIRGVGLFAIQVKGGSYQYRRDDDREWYLRKLGEWETVPSPLKQTWSGADALIHSLPRIQGFRSFVLPVLLFTDMDPDRDIEARADRDKVHPLFGADDLNPAADGVGQGPGGLLPAHRRHHLHWSQDHHPRRGHLRTCRTPRCR